MNGWIERREDGKGRTEEGRIDKWPEREKGGWRRKQMGRGEDG